MARTVLGWEQVWPWPIMMGRSKRARNRAARGRKPDRGTASKAALPAGLEPMEKVAFSCWAVESFRTRLAASGKRQILLGGIEAHVCVLMSALDLLAAGFAVHVVADAVTSRTQANWRLAMDYLRQAGAVVTTTETALFQLLGQADSDAFRELARLIR